MLSSDSDIDDHDDDGFPPPLTKRLKQSILNFSLAGTSSQSSDEVASSISVTGPSDRTATRTSDQILDQAASSGKCYCNCLLAANT